MTAAPIALYLGRTHHIRRQPRRHHFNYRLASVLLDVDRLADIAKASNLFRINRPGLVSFFEKDHGDRTGAPLRPWVEKALARIGVKSEGRIELLTLPRVFNYVFNPISLFICRDAYDQPSAVVYEVNNTFGETHAYAAALGDGARHRHDAEKRFHVSPFFDADGRYDFKLRAPDARFGLDINYDKNGETLFYATWRAARQAFSDATLARSLITHPWVTGKTIGAIHWEALRLVAKGAKYRGKPSPPRHAFTEARAARIQD